MDNKTIKLENQIDELSSQLASNFYKTIQTLSSLCVLLERYYEGSHSRFVSDKAAILAKELNFSDTDVMEIRIAGLLHDIGKAGFPDMLLAKPAAKMNALERDKYVKHPELAMQILKNHNGFDTIGEIIYQHHERLDGSGFPRHLHSGKILPSTMILAVSDTYHNMVYRIDKDKSRMVGSSMAYSSTTSYLSSTENTFAQAINYLKSKRKLFGDKIVKAFLEIVQEERVDMGNRTVLRIPVSKIENGMIFAEDYYTSYGLMIAAKGEIANERMKRSLINFAEAKEIPHKILVIK